MHPSLFLYNSLLGLVYPLALPAFWLSSALVPAWAGQRPRLGLQSAFPFTPAARRGLWMQAASVGEINLAASILANYIPWPAGKRITVTSGTLPGLRQARNCLGEKIQTGLLPLDLPWAVKAAILRVRPRVYVSLETEIWPNLLWLLHKSKVKILMINGRISPRSYPRYLKIRPLMAACLSFFSRLSMISQSDAERVIALGADPARVTVGGNAKYGGLAARLRAADLSGLRRRLNLDGSPLLVAGSVRSGEEIPVLEAFARTRRQGAGAILLAAPRHIHNAGKWYKAASRRGLRAEYWSRITVRDPAVTVIVLDEMGPLFNFYGLAAAVFVGGSLVDKGGHNPLEPAAWGKPLAYGPYMQDFSDALLRLSPDMARMTPDLGRLSQFWIYCLENPGMISHMGTKIQAEALALGQAAGQAAELIREYLDD
ncbi:MAG: hypothetical protein LBJ14_00615 [Desulfarculales bacterium]|jgi:3-deoxy-D-manno-octulosonic-acid transferase|nr:hypothetical protein [Desulfarculales bacterium]